LLRSLSLSLSLSLISKNRNKPPYYPKLVPTSKVPAVFVKPRDAPAEERGELVFESLDILAKLESMFPEGALAPSDPEAARATREALEGADALVMAAFGLVRAVAPPPPAGSPYAAMGPPPSPDEARASLEAKLDKLEELLGLSEGPFVGGTSPSTADVALAPQLERVAATLPASGARFAIRGNEQRPRITAWFDALETLPAYLETRGDAGTHRAVSKRLLGSSLAEPKFLPKDGRAAAECAAKITKNRAAIKKDILKNAGLASFASPSSESEPSIDDDVDNALRRLVSTLVSGHPGPAAQAPATFASPPEPAAAARAAATNAVAAAVAAFLASRVSAPRDMSGSAAEELRAACLRVAQGAYTGL
jgi:glutathione S-transferase